MDLCNGRLLQLIECIESMKNDVKKKMMLHVACDACTKVTCEYRDDEIFSSIDFIAAMLEH